MEWRILLAFVLLVILLGSVLSIAYEATPAVRNLPDTTEVTYNMINVNPVAYADADASTPTPSYPTSPSAVTFTSVVSE